jgi:hypothetical protein
MKIGPLQVRGFSLIESARSPIHYSSEMGNPARIIFVHRFVEKHLVGLMIFSPEA